MYVLSACWRMSENGDNNNKMRRSVYIDQEMTLANVLTI
jgi:hypothetical protein